MMAKRSLKASPSGIIKAKQAFQRREWTQEYLAGEVGLQTRQPIWKFFSGRPIERHLFIDICFQLNLDWEEIADRPNLDDPGPEVEQSTSSQPEVTVTEWVEQIRQSISPILQAQCGVLQTTIDLAQPLPLQQVYTNLYLLPHLSSQRWLELDDLQSETTTGRLSTVAPSGSRVEAMAAVVTHPRLHILGKPGAGKTTLLQYLALQCLSGSFRSHAIPIFIALRHLASGTTLEDWIQQQWADAGMSPEQTNTVLKQGHALLLLDGLDEVDPAEQSSLHYQIQRFADTYHQTAIVLTSRLGGQDYYFHGFTSMEVADFDPGQITIFVRRWFTAMNPAATTIGEAKAELFLEQIQQRENQPILELAVTPVLLHLACLVFQERGAFPKKRSQLYQSSLDILLVRWDVARGIQRLTTAGDLNLPLADRVSILSQVAATLFERGQYFFDKAEIVPLIGEYLASRNPNQDPETLWQSGEAVLRAIACHHGLLIERARDVYSFSHLTFQEFLTARRCFLKSTLTNPADGNTALQTLGSQVLDPRWHEVIALTAELMPQADPLMLAMVEQLQQVAKTPALQQILQWTERKSQANSLPYEPAARRAFYFSLAIFQGLDLASALDPQLAIDLHPELALDRSLLQLLTLAKVMLVAPLLEQSLSLCFAFDLERGFPVSPALAQQLQDLREPLFMATQSQETLQNWCDAAGEQWLLQLQKTLIQERDLGYDWQLTSSQWEQVNSYYQANLFIMRCLNRGIRTSRKFHVDLRQILLMP